MTGLLVLQKVKAPNYFTASFEVIVKFKKIHIHDSKYWVDIIIKLQIILCHVIRLTHFLKRHYTGLNSAFLKLWEVRSWHPVLLFHGSRRGKVEAVTDFIFLGSKITEDSDCSHEIKRHLLLGRKTMTDLNCVLKSEGLTLLTKVCIVKAIVFPEVM